VESRQTRVLLLLLFVFMLVFSTGLAGTRKSSRRGKQSKAAKQICITFDELPVAEGFGNTDAEAVNFLILDALKQHKVKAAGFVVGEEVNGAWDILGQWLNNGHILGSLTYSNQDYNYISTSQFIDDIKRGMETIEPMLSAFGQKRRYFRYPYQHYGTTIDSRRKVQLYLEDAGIIAVPATVIPEDYLYNLSLDKLGKYPDSAAYSELMNEYINHVLDELVRVEDLAKELVRRPVRHILLLRANRLNAVFLDDLLTALEAEGYQFVSLHQALRDKVYRKKEAYLGMKGLGYLDRIVQSDPDLLPAE